VVAETRQDRNRLKRVAAQASWAVEVWYDGQAEKQAGSENAAVRHGAGRRGRLGGGLGRWRSSRWSAWSVADAQEREAAVFAEGAASSYLEGGSRTGGL
jgi:hypothetical protein